jgi:hypothetical protein
MEGYRFVLDKLEIRSPVSGGRKNYVVKGYALNANKKDMYRFDKNPDGSIRAFKSLFTDNALSSIDRQMRSKRVFVDAEHLTAANLSIRSALKSIVDKASEKGVNVSGEVDNVNSYLRISQLPFGKPAEWKVTDSGLLMELHLNPHFRELDDNHRKYFDATWNSLNDGFINGISVNYRPTKVESRFVDGEWVDVIDDLDIYGVSLVSEPALSDNAITEVAIRSMMEFKRSQTEEDKMTEDKGNNVEEKNQGGRSVEDVAALKKELEALKSKVAAGEELSKQEKLDAEKKAHADEMERLRSELEALKAEKSDKSKSSGGVPFARGEVRTDFDEMKSKRDVVNFIRDKAKDLSLGELIALGREIDSTKYLPEETRVLLGKSGADITARK